MTNWHEWSCWTWFLFDGEDDCEDRAFATFFWSFILIMPTVVGSVFITAITPWLIFGTVSLALFIVYKAPTMHRYHVLDGISKYYAKDHAQFYYNCTKHERAMYPANIVDVFNTWDLLDYDQEHALNRRLDDLENQIKSLRKVHAQAERKHIDIDEVLFELERSKQHAKIEVDTYREFLS